MGTWQDYARGRHADWVENEKVHFYHYWLTYFAAVIFWITFVAVMIDSFHIQQTPALAVPAWTGPPLLYAVWLRRRRKQIIQRNVIEKLVGDVVVRVHPETSAASYPLEKKFTLSWPNICANCSASRPVKYGHD